MERSNTKMKATAEYAKVNFRWRRLYKFGGVSALIIAIFLIGEIVVYSVLPRLNTTIETFELFRDNCLAGLLIFDLLGMISYLLFIPMILSLYVALRQTNESIYISKDLLTVAISFYFAAIIFLFIWVILSSQRIYKMSGNYHKANKQI